MSQRPTVVINGEKKSLDSALSLTQLVAFLGLEEAPVAIAVNRSHVRRDDYDQRHVQDGDVIDLLRPMAGG